MTAPALILCSLRRAVRGTSGAEKRRTVACKTELTSIPPGCQFRGHDRLFVIMPRSPGRSTQPALRLGVSHAENVRERGICSCRSAAQPPRPGGTHEIEQDQKRCFLTLKVTANQKIDSVNPRNYKELQMPETIEWE